MTEIENHCTCEGISRRSALAVGAVGVSAVALAACSKANNTSSTRAPASTNESGSSGPSTPAGGTSSAAASSTPGSGGAVLAALSDVAVGKSVSARTSGGQDILITRTGSDTVVGFSAVCTHQGCTVAATFQCPCHGSVYDPKTGANVSGPAPRPLSPVNVRISGGNVVEA